MDNSEDHPATRTNPLAVDYVARAADAFGVTVAEMTGEARNRLVTRARWAVMLVMRERRGLSSTQIGMRLGKDHSTVLHGLRLGAELRASDPEFADRCARIASGLTFAPHARIVVTQERVPCGEGLEAW